MADSKSGEKSIEMRLAEIEDKLSKLHITEDEMKAFHKVNNLMGGQAAVEPDVTANLSPTVCVVPRQISRNINRSIISPRINRGIGECFECSCGPCGGAGGGFGGG